jgi:hypothetical protein
MQARNNAEGGAAGCNMDGTWICEGLEDAPLSPSTKTMAARNQSRISIIHEDQGKTDVHARTSELFSGTPLLMTWRWSIVIIRLPGKLTQI